MPVSHSSVERHGFGDGDKNCHRHNHSKKCVSHQDPVHNTCMHVQLQRFMHQWDALYCIFSSILLHFFNASYIPLNDFMTH